MKFLQFIFSSFWVWAGFVIMLLVIGGGVIELVKACKPEKRRIETYRDADRLKVTTIGASAKEAREAHKEVVIATYNGYGYKLDENRQSGEEQNNEK